MSVSGRLMQSRSALCLYLMVLLVGTLTPVEDEPGIWNYLLGNLVIEVAVNLVLLMPFAGFLLYQFRLSNGRAVSLCLLTTISIESLQLLVPGRVSDLRDILLNAVGAVIIVLVAKRFTHLLEVPN